MQINFLGSAATEGIPSPFCDCKTCTHARKYQGKNIRKRCSYMINNELLVDIGPDLFISCAMYNIDLLDTKYILVSHSHLDHLCIHNLKLREEHLHKHTHLQPVTLVAGPSTMTLLNRSGAQDESMGVKREPILPYDTVDLPPYTIKSIKATHYPESGDAMNYIIDDGDKKILIASDTSVYKDEAWSYLENQNLDLLIIEATKGTNPSDEVHMGIDGLEYTVHKMKQMGTITANTAVYATHFSHQNCPPHEELTNILQRIGVKCVYDGLSLNI